MVIDLRKTVIRKKLRSFYYAIIFTTSISLVLFVNIYSRRIFGIDKYLISIILASAYLLTIVYSFIREYNYIYYSDEKEKIILRFFSMNIFISKKSSIEIIRSEMAGYSLKKSFIGLKEKLFLYQQTKRGVAKYPGVSITALSKEEKEKLIKSLDRLGRRF